jgi:prephenate dehydrogenase
MAGSEKSGWRHSHAELFCNRPCFVTPLRETEEQAVGSVVAFWKSLDMRVTTVAPELHDEIVANISHLPHILATTLCHYLATKDPFWGDFAGEGLRDSTRIASGQPLLWQGIVEQNREEVIRALTEFERQFQTIRAAISDSRSDKLLRILEEGKAYRDRFPPKSSGKEHSSPLRE